MHTVPHHMQVDLSELRAAISIACRLGFASRLPNPRDATGARRSGAPHTLLTSSPALRVTQVAQCLCFQRLGLQCNAGPCSLYLSLCSQAPQMGALSLLSMRIP